MKRLHFTDIQNQQLVDVRSQQDFQTGHIKGALNLNPGNYQKYAAIYLDAAQPIVFLVETEDDTLLSDLVQASATLGYDEVAGYLVMADVPEESLEKAATISAADFFQKEDFILLDVRHPDEITRPAPEKNLVNIPFEDLVTAYKDLDENKTIYTLCGSGNRGTAAASYLLSKGLKPVVIEGGMKAIQAHQNK